MKNIAVSLMLQNITQAHTHMDETMDGVTNEIASFSPPGKANSIAGVYAHVLFSEDFFIHSLLMGTKPLYETEWKDKTGISELQPTEGGTAFPKWLKEVTVDVTKARTYAKAVNKATQEYLATLKDEDLEKKVDMSIFGMGEITVGDFLGGMVIGHVWSIMGEVSVLKGIQGLKGYPF